MQKQDFNFEHYQNLLDSVKVEVEGYQDSLVPLPYVLNLINDILLSDSESMLKGLDKALQEYRDSLQDLNNILNDTKRL